MFSLGWFYQILSDSVDTKLDSSIFQFVLSALEVNLNCAVLCNKTTVMNQVSFLLKTPFSRLSLSEKLEVKKLGVH